MKVLLVAPQPFFAARGTPIAVRRLAETLCAQGHEVDLLTYPFGDDIEIDGLTIHRCRRLPGIRDVRIGFSVGKLLMDVPLVGRLIRMAGPGRYDVVHAVEESIYPALALRWRHGARVVYDMDSSLADQMRQRHGVFRLLHPVLSRVEQWAIRSADVVAPMCDHLAEYAASLRDVDDTVVLHDLPVEVEPAPADSKPAPADGAADGCLALYVGNLEAYQGIDMLLDAAALLPARSPVRIRVVGGSIDKAERFRSIARRRGLRDRIRFVGPRPLAHLQDLLSRADILLSPRTQGDNTPLKVYSYMNSGRPILATRLRTHTQVLDDSTALLVEPKAEDFAHGILRLAHDAELRSRLAESARQRVTSDYSPSSFHRRVSKIYGRTRSNATSSESPACGRSNNPWDGADRRRTADRRTAEDRRSVPRAGADRRVAERRAPAYA